MTRGIGNCGGIVVAVPRLVRMQKGAPIEPHNQHRHYHHLTSNCWHTLN